MDEFEVLHRLKTNKNTYVVPLSAYDNTEDSIAMLALEFCQVSHIAHKAGIPEVTFMLSGLGREWSKAALDEIHQFTRDLRAEDMLESDEAVSYRTKVLKVGFWCEDKDSYGFRIFEPDNV